METLERLRGVREHVQEEADAFITEVRIKINTVVAMLNSYNRGYLDGCPLTQIGDCCSFALFRCALCRYQPEIWRSRWRKRWKSGRKTDLHQHLTPDIDAQDTRWCGRWLSTTSKHWRRWRERRDTSLSPSLDQPPHCRCLPRGGGKVERPMQENGKEVSAL